MANTIETSGSPAERSNEESQESNRRRQMEQLALEVESDSGKSTEERFLAAMLLRNLAIEASLERITKLLAGAIARGTGRHRDSD
jgi:hypothetical protein